MLFEKTLIFSFSLFLKILIVFIELCNCEESLFLHETQVFNGHGKVGQYPLNSKTCGLHNTEDFISKRIRGGDVAVQGDFPWSAQMIYFHQENRFTPPEMRFACGASLISDYWLITARHCFQNYPPNGRIEFYFGTIHRFEGLRRYEMDFFLRHPEFDVALVRVKTRIEPLIISNKYQINTICLPTANLLNNKREEAVFAGWGAIDNEGKIESNILRTAIYSIEPLEVCKRKYALPDESVCVETVRQMNCYGDSGSSLVQLDRKQAVLIGVASNHGPNPDRCDTGWINFIRVSLFVDWIRNIIENDPKTDRITTTTTRKPITQPNGDNPQESDPNHSHDLNTKLILPGIQIFFITIYYIFICF